MTAVKSVVLTRPCTLGLLLGLVSSLDAIALGDEAPQPPGGLTVRDVVVFMADVNGDKLNSPAMFKSTLPDFASPLREPAPGPGRNPPMPIGLVSVEGVAPKGLDIVLEFPDGRMKGLWPPAEVKSKQIVWLDIVGDTNPTPGDPLPEGHWLAPMRLSSRTAITGKGRAERFMVYDVQLPYTCPLKVIQYGSGYGLSNTGQYPLHDVTLVRPEKGSWATGAVVLLPGIAKPAAGAPPSRPAPPTANEPPPKSPTWFYDTVAKEFFVAESTKIAPFKRSNGNTAVRAHVFTCGECNEKERFVGYYEKYTDEIRQKLEANNQAFTIKEQAFQGRLYSKDAETWVAAEKPEGIAITTELQQRCPPKTLRYCPPSGPDDKITAAAPARQEHTAAMAISKVKLGEPLPADGALTPLAARLGELGLGEPEVKHTLAILKQHALTEKFIVVYRLDGAELDKILPIEVTPSPQKLVRVGLVVLLNADPALLADIGKLVTQLGDVDWKKREAAHKRLTELGNAARPALAAAVNNPDPEIAYRAEQILEVLPPK